MLAYVGISDTTAFKNASHSNQGDSQLNFECGAVTVKGLNVTIISHSIFLTLNVPQHIQSDIQNLNFPLSWDDDEAVCCGQQVSLLITRVGILSCVDPFVSKPFKMWEREIWNLNITLNMPRHIQSQEYWIWDDSHIQAFDCDCPTFKRHIRLMWLNQLNLNMTSNQL